MRIVNSTRMKEQAAPERTESRTPGMSPHDLVNDLRNFGAGGAVDEAAVASRLRTTLCKIYPCEVAKVEDGVFTVDVEAALLQEDRLVEEYNAAAMGIAGVKALRVHLLSSNIWGLG